MAPAHGYAGYIFVIDEPRRAELLQTIAGGSGLFGRRFSDAISALDQKPKSVELFLLSAQDGELSYAAVGRKGPRVATAKFRVTFSDFLPLDAIPLASIEERIGARLTRHLIRSRSGAGHRVPQKTWDATMAAIRQLRPNRAEALAGLEQRRQLSHQSFRGEGAGILAMERDGVGVALDIFGADRPAVLSSWELSLTDRGVPPFLRGLNNVRHREDPLIIHDAASVPGWEQVARYVVGAVEFRRGDERLTVFNVNRTRVEEALGVDLIYYHHRYDAYVLVQYKRMLREGNAAGELVYRPIDPSYGREVERISSFLRDNPDRGGPRAPLDYRLDPSAFFFKLCEAESVDPLSQELVRGMYVPFAYWELLSESGHLRGSQGGLRASYETVGRYLTNSLFIELVQAGWIGSRNTSTTALTEIVRQQLDDSRSVLVAISATVS